MRQILKCKNAIEILDMKVKLLIIANYGPATNVSSEGELFIQLKKQFDHDMTIMTNEDSFYAQKFKEAGIRVIDFYPSKKFSITQVKRIRDELKTGNYQIAHFFSNKAMINGNLAALGLPVKVAIYRGYTGNIHWWDPFMYLKFLSPRVDAVVCLVEAIRLLIRKNLFFNKDKAITINKGHDVTWYDPVNPVELKSLSIPEDAFVFVCVANVRTMKGMKYLLKATHYLPSESHAYLLLLGNGMDKFRFKKIIDTSPMRDRIINLGFRKDALSVVKSCNVFVLASIYGEAITKSVIEAMCLSVAPVITDIPGNVGLVINNESGLVVPPRDPKALADAMLKLSQDKELTKRLGQKAREHIDKNLNTKDTVKAFDAMYRDLASKK